jgi:hypothetical protein
MHRPSTLETVDLARHRLTPTNLRRAVGQQASRATEIDPRRSGVVTHVREFIRPLPHRLFEVRNRGLQNYAGLTPLGYAMAYGRGGVGCVLVPGGYSGSPDPKNAGRGDIAAAPAYLEPNSRLKPNQ